MSFEMLQRRLATLQDTNQQIQTLIERLGSLRFPPGTSKQEAEQDITELNDEVAQALKEQAEDLELLDQEIIDLPDGRKGSDLEAAKERLLDRCFRAFEELKKARTEYSKAQRSAIRTRKLMERATREMHIQSLLTPPSQDDQNGSQPISRRRTPLPETQEDKTVAAAGDVTEALRRTHALLSSELSRSQFAHDTLKESSAALSQLSETYSSLDSVLASTRTLLGTLLRSQKSDTWYLETAFYILCATIGWLIFRRFIYGPAWWFIYLPLKLTWNAWMSLFTLMGLRSGGSAMTSVIQSSAVAATTIIPGTTAVQATVSGTDAPRVGLAGRAGRGNLKPPSDDTEPQNNDEHTQPLSEEVGQMVEESRERAQGGQPQEQSQHQEEQVQRNPKKRQWDEAVEAPKHAAEEQKHKDEL